ncbi:MAG: hypothetical protein GF400_10915 [Candidatus Eisenbacteria bacterium]|nr:hypothetical protein [Candidatus Eisenbacteria bacterium]
MHEPVVQIMSWTDTLMTIVYPEEQRAFLVRRSPGPMPELLVPSAAHRYVARSLEAIGYELEDYATAGDTTILEWRHPRSDEIGALASRILTEHVDELPVSISSFDRKGNRVSGIRFSSYVEVGEMTIPLLMERWRTHDASSTTETESVTLSDPVWLDDLPEDALFPDIDSDYELLRYDFTNEE